MPGRQGRIEEEGGRSEERCEEADVRKRRENELKTIEENSRRVGRWITGLALGGQRGGGPYCSVAPTSTQLVWRFLLSFATDAATPATTTNAATMIPAADADLAIE
jgi:hypothetical protein